MTRPTQIGGNIQVHYRYNLNGATVDAGNAVQWLAGLVDVTGRPEHQALLDELRAVHQKIIVARDVAQAAFDELLKTDREKFDRCRFGFEPWPGEIVEGFEPICTCERRCLFHVTQAPTATEADCNCELVCPRHLIPREPGDRTPILSLSKPDELLPISLPTVAELSSFDHSSCKHQENICLLYQSDEQLPGTTLNVASAVAEVERLMGFTPPVEGHGPPWRDEQCPSRGPGLSHMQNDSPACAHCGVVVYDRDK